MGSRGGFTLIEFMMASTIMLLISTAVFELLARAQHVALFQAEMHEVMDNTRIAMDIVTRYIRHAANDPFQTGFEGITIVGPAEVRLRTDTTGSGGSANPDKGDPDGDTDDSAEDVRIRYNSTDHTIELTTEGGSAQAIANGISSLSMNYMDANGVETAVGSRIRKIRVTITGSGTVPDPQTHRIFSLKIACDVRIASRR